MWHNANITQTSNLEGRILDEFITSKARKLNLPKPIKSHQHCKGSVQNGPLGQINAWTCNWWKIKQHPTKKHRKPT